MDLSLLPTSASDYNKQRTGVRFTVRSANSPSYSLTRRSGVRKPRSSLEEEKESREEVKESERHGTHTGTNGTNKDEDHIVSGCLARIGSRSSVKGQCKEKETSSHKTSTGLNQQGTAEKTITDFGTDRSGNSNPASEIRGRTDFRRYNLPSRSKSVDWRTGERSPDRSKKDERFMLSTKREGEVSKQAGDLDERISGVQGLRGRVMSSVQAYNSAGMNNDVGQRSLVTNMSQTFDRTSRGQSLPSRFRSQSGIGSGVGETSGGQTILERIEKLYGSAGFDKTDESSKTRDFLTPGSTTGFHVQQRISGGTFPRRLSSGQKNRLSPVQSTKSFAWTQKDTSDSASYPSSGTSRTWGQWQEQPKDSYPEERGVHWGRGSEDTGTRSLDRARSKYTLAAQIRSARAAEGITEPIQSNKILEEEKSYALKDFSVLKESRANEDRDQVRVSHRQEEGKQEKEKNTEVETKQKTDLKSSSADDVFESNPQKTTMKTIGKKNFPEMLPVPSAASVKNKISQFEALTQRSLGLATGQVLMPRRAFSVPTQLSKAHDGVKKSGSAKAIGELRDKWEGLKKGEEAGEKTEENVTRIGKQLGTGRSLSVDEVGLRLGSKEKERNDLTENEKKDFNSGNNSAEGSDNYSRLKSSLEIPLNGGAQRRKRFYVDETDSPKESSPGEEFKRPSSLLYSPSDTFTGVQTTTPSPVSDDDKTPTNTPNDSPFLSAAAQPDDATPTADRENESTPAVTHAAGPSKPDSPPLSRPLATSSLSNLSELISPNVSAALPNGKGKVLDLNAWVAGVNVEVKPWNEDEDDYEDDDDDDDDDDDESTQKDEDSNYDSDSGESSVTITSNMSQSDRKSFCVSLSDLCNFAGADYESENDSDEWQPAGRRSASLSSDMSALSCVSVMPSEELDKLLEDVRSLGDNNLQDYNDVKVVVLHKEVGAGLGFTVAGGADQNKPVTVHKVIKSGVAAQEGSIREGDQVLSINGTSLCGFVHWEALRVLRRAKTRDLGVVVLRREETSSACIGGASANNPGPTQTQLTKTGQHVCVRLEKNSRDLGFSLEGGVGSNQDNKPLTVQKIFQGGPVDKVRPGDEVLEIDGMSMVGMRRLEAWTWIRGLPPGPVDVVLRRPL